MCKFDSKSMFIATTLTLLTTFLMESSTLMAQLERVSIVERELDDRSIQVLLIDGTSDSDVVSVDSVEDGMVRVTFNGESELFAKENIQRIRFLGRSGDDDFTNATDISSALFGHNGDDILRGGSGNNWIQGGNGDDEIYGGDKNDLLRGRAGNDYIEAGKRHDRVFGGPGRDVIVAGPGNDFVKGEEGDDVIYGGNGDDRIDGGPGSDEIMFGNSVEGDIALYDGDLADSLIEFVDPEVLVSDGGDLDMLENVDFLRFDDQDVAPEDFLLELTDVEEEVLRMLNQLRASNGKAPLKVKFDLTQFGRDHFVDHDLEHSLPIDRRPLFVNNRSSWGENVGYLSPRNGSATSIARAMHDSWRNSPTHYRNMIDGGFDEVGIAAVRKSDGWYFMQFFMGSN